MSAPGPATFIVGDPRSGTSLLRALLDGHPDLLVLPFETHLFDWVEGPAPADALLGRTKLLPTLATHRPDVAEAVVRRALGAAFAGAAAPRDRLPALAEAWAGLTEVATGRRWVEKTPRNLYELDTLFRWYPADARVLVMRRDPRDVVASEMRSRARPGLLAATVARRLAHEALSAFDGDPRVHGVRYESLVAEPARVMRGVCDFLGVGFTPSVTEPTVMGVPYGGNSRFDQALKGVSGAAVGRHRGELTAAQRRSVEELLAPVMERGGYLPEAGAAAPLDRAARIALELVAASGLWRSRSVRTALRGG